MGHIVLRKVPVGAGGGHAGDGFRKRSLRLPARTAPVTNSAEFRFGQREG
jgi:hypothetical protein